MKVSIKPTKIDPFIKFEQLDLWQRFTFARSICTVSKETNVACVKTSVDKYVLIGTKEVLSIDKNAWVAPVAMSDVKYRVGNIKFKELLKYETFVFADRLDQPFMKINEWAALDLRYNSVAQAILADAYVVVISLKSVEGTYKT
jgi:hypothetical protein